MNKKLLIILFASSANLYCNEKPIENLTHELSRSHSMSPTERALFLDKIDGITGLADAPNKRLPKRRAQSVIEKSPNKKQDFSFVIQKASSLTKNPQSFLEHDSLLEALKYTTEPRWAFLPSKASMDRETYDAHLEDIEDVLNTFANLATIDDSDEKEVVTLKSKINAELNDTQKELQEKAALKKLKHESRPSTTTFFEPIIGTMGRSQIAERKAPQTTHFVYMATDKDLNPLDN